MKKSMFIILLSILFISCSSHRYILFEHIGAIDKPITCIVIAKERAIGKEFCYFQEESVIKSESFLKVEKYVLSHDTRLNGSNSVTSFGSFKVQLDGKTAYLIDGDQNAITYFTNLVLQLKSMGNQELADMLETNILIRLKGV